jgi:hypothetical protein
MQPVQQPANTNPAPPAPPAPPLPLTRRRQQYMDILEDMFRSRTLFFREPRPALDQTTFLYSEATGMQLLWNVMYPDVALYPPVQQTIQQINITFPDNVWDPVEVRATNDEVEEALLPAEPTDHACVICQEDLTSDVVKLRNCNHCYHNSCIRTWFESSVYCPTCRNDIRTSLQDTTTEDGGSDDGADSE